jgi:hypothetical protein
MRVFLLRRNMAIQKAVNIVIRIIGDGSTTSFDFDVNQDPYFVEHSAGDIQNWFSENPRTSFPSAASAGGGITASLAGSVVTVTFSTAPSGSTTVPLVLMFG